MAMDSAVLKAAIDAEIPTRAQLQTTLWNALYAIGFRDWHDHANASYVTGVRAPSIKDLSDTVAGIMHDHIQTVQHKLCDKAIAHIIAYEQVTSVGADPQGGSVTSNSTVIA